MQLPAPVLFAALFLNSDRFQFDRRPKAAPEIKSTSSSTHQRPRVQLILEDLAKEMRRMRHGAGPKSCDVIAHLDSGPICGVTTALSNETVYASFLGVPYAKAPLGELRFKELQPMKRWNFRNTIKEGPVCPQKDELFGKLMKPRNMSEDCIYANIHAPIEAIPIKFYEKGDFTPISNLSIVVNIHGGAFQSGSGDTDIYGPEKLVAKNVIVVTFNYRLNVFGFLSLNSSSVPGNNGLRDVITLLRWVKRNAHAFGGNPDDITLMGQGAGATCAHLLTLTPVVNILFHRMVLMSGTAISPFYTLSPVYAKEVASKFLAKLGIESTDPEEIHKQLVTMPLDSIMNAYFKIQDHGLVTFSPVIESKFAGVAPVLDTDVQNQEVLISKGRFVPLIVGYTNNECESIYHRLDKLKVLHQLTSSPISLVPLKLLYSLDNEAVLETGRKIEKRYFNGTITKERYMKYCEESMFKYPAVKVARQRALLGRSPAFLYRFSYNADANVIKRAFKLNYTGAGHMEDMALLFRESATHIPDNSTDASMMDWMVSFIVNFTQCNDPTCSVTSRDASPWPRVRKFLFTQQVIEHPGQYNLHVLTDQEEAMKTFFDYIYIDPRTLPTPMTPTLPAFLVSQSTISV